MIGKTLLHYEILEKLGSGGMGVVYKARDTKLGREVALKVLPEDMALNPDRRTRFQREAMAVAALKHPHIVTIHSVEETKTADGTDAVFLTMELIEGDSLDRLIPPQGLNLARLLDLATPVAEAVAYAHEKGITHRDLKPGNIMLDEAGRPKVLDFGLAKLLEPPVDAQGATLAADGSVTKEGVVIGTASYMSPEQAEGKPTDARSDVFSLGVILYEMATGQKPFQGDTTISTISSILKDTPRSVTELNRSLPNHLGRVVNRCLAKDPSKRYQVAHDLKNELEGLREESSGVGEIPPASEIGLAPAAPPDSQAPPASAASAVSAPTGGGKSRTPMIVGVVAVVALIAVLVVMKPWSGGGGSATTGETAAPVSEPVTPEAAAKPERKMAVVLPFENLGPPEDAYFAAGMTEEITNRLASVGDLGVISRTSAVGYDRTGKTMKQIGADLGVDYVLEGTVRWAKIADGGGQVRISPKLVRVSDDLQLWSETYDRQITDIFEVQSDIAAKVVGELGVTLSGSEQALLAESPTENMEAYQAYLQAIDLSMGDPAEFDRKKVELLDRAIQLDPGFLRAWYELTRHHANGYFNMDQTQARLDLARAALEGIEGVDPDHPMTRLARGYYLYYGFNEYERAVEEFTAASEALPNEVECRKAMAYINRRLGNFEECIRDLELALELDPQDNQILTGLAETLTAVRRFDEAERTYRQVLDREPGDDGTRFALAGVLLRARGDMAAAKEVMSHGPGDIPLWHIGGSAILKFWERDYAGTIALMESFPTPVPVLKANRSFLIATATAELEGAEGAREELKTAVRDVQAVLETSPSSSDMRGTLATLYAYQGKSALALQEARLGVSLSAKDVFSGPDALATLAGIHARLGREAEAIDILERLIVTPAQNPVTVPMLELDASWDPLRQNLRFQDMLEKHREKIP